LLVTNVWNGSKDSDVFVQFTQHERSTSLDAGLLTTRSPHLWQARIPESLARGSHTARVVTVDQHGREFDDVIAFEVMPEPPPAFFRSEVFE
jgi:hypothetical protein